MTLVCYRQTRALFNVNAGRPRFVMPCAGEGRYFMGQRERAAGNYVAAISSTARQHSSADIDWRVEGLHINITPRH